MSALPIRNAASAKQKDRREAVFQIAIGRN
jgi:hypothetical protein